MASRGCVCFVGNLPGDVREREIEDLFYKVSPPVGLFSCPEMRAGAILEAVGRIQCAAAPHET